MRRFSLEPLLSQSPRLNHLQTTCMYAEVSYLVEQPPYCDLLRLSLRQEVRRSVNVCLLFSSTLQVLGRVSRD